MSDKSTKKKDDKKLAADTKEKGGKKTAAASKASKAASKDASKKSGGNPLKTFSKSLREYRSEMKKISWPTAKDTTKNALITLGAILVVGVFIWVLDFGLNSLRDVALEKIPQWSIFSKAEDVSASDASEGLVFVSGGDAAQQAE